MSSRFPFAIGEWYHCYTRSIDKRATFKSRRDYERFVQQLHLCNTSQSKHRSNMRDPTLAEVLKIPITEKLTAIGAFCLMPNHFHLLLQEIKEGGISTFMQKIGTAYTMYFNIKYERTGGLFIGPFRSKHIADDVYLQRVIQYIHCNPAEIFEPQWKEGVVNHMATLEKRLQEYPYASLGAYSDNEHEFRKILDASVFEIETQASLHAILGEAREYYNDLRQGEALTQV